MRTEWVVLADANRARIFARVGGGGWQDIRDLTRGDTGKDDGREMRLPAAMQKLSRVITPARLQDTFLARLGRELCTARKRGDFDALVLVAPTDVLEPLQAMLDAATRRKLTATATEDMVGLPIREARRQLSRRF